MSPFTLVVVLFVLLLTYSLARMAIQANAAGGGRRREAEETQLVQDIHRQLEHIEQRVEALETILLDRETTRTKTSSRLD